MKWPVLFALFCTLLGFWVNNEIVPRGHEIRRSLKTKVSVQTGLSVLEPGRVIADFPNIKMYFARKEGNWLYDLVVIDYSSPKIDRMITADKALVSQSGTDVGLELYHMTVDPVDENHQTMARANRFVYTIKDVLKNSKYRKRAKDYRFMEMIAEIRKLTAEFAGVKGSGKAADAERHLQRKDISYHKVELSKRFVFAAASICFVLIGIPLGIRSQRKDSSIGMAISLAVSLGYYVLVILMLSCEKMYRIRPELLIWLPVLLCLVLAARLVRRHL